MCGSSAETLSVTEVFEAQSATLYFNALVDGFHFRSIPFPDRAASFFLGNLRARARSFLVKRVTFGSSGGFRAHDPKQTRERERERERETGNPDSLSLSLSPTPVRERGGRVCLFSAGDAPVVSHIPRNTVQAAATGAVSCCSRRTRDSAPRPRLC